MKSLMYSIVGAVFATGLILACSDDSPDDADAAVCECPAAEPPIPSRLTKVRGLDNALAANSGAFGLATCPAGSTLLTGHCYVVNDPGTPPQAALRGFAPDPTDARTWICEWANFNLGTAVVHAEAVCLVP